jgi:hypothetical protein
VKRALLAIVVTSALGFGSAGPAVANEGQPAPASRPGSSLQLVEVGHVNPGPGANGDVFGHRGHAYLASWVGNQCMSNGVRVYNLANPAAPRHVSTFADVASEPDLVGTWTEKVIVQRVDTRWFHGDVAVVSFQNCDIDDTEAFRGFALYDVTNPARPRPLARYEAEVETRGSHEIWLGAHGGRAYVYTAILLSEWNTAPVDEAGNPVEPGREDFRIVDVSNPRSPREVGEWGAWRELDVLPVQEDGETTRTNFVHSVIVDERLTRAYLSYWDLGTVILDIRNPRRPRFLGQTTPTQGNAHSVNLANGGRVLVETHEISGGLPVFYDISNPARPRELTNFTIDLAEDSSVHDPKVRGSKVFFSWYDLGIVVADISRPTQPRLLAQFIPDDPTPNPDFCEDVGCPQVWGVFLLGGYVLASDMNSGLYVLALRRGSPSEAPALVDEPTGRTGPVEEPGRARLLADVRSDEAALERLMARQLPDHYVHCAWMFESIQDAQDALEG